MGGRNASEYAHELLNRLNSIDGISISSNQTITKSPSIILSVLKSETIFKRFVEVYEWFIKEIKNKKSG